MLTSDFGKNQNYQPPRLNYLLFVIGFGVELPFGGAVGFGVGLVFFDGATGFVSGAGGVVFDAVDAGVGDGFAVGGGEVCALVFAAGGFFAFTLFAAVAGCCALAL